MQNTKLVDLLCDLRGQTVRKQYKLIEAYVNSEVQRIVFKKMRNKKD